MKLETFFNKFDQFADAPNAVAKMRELVLHLAFSGQPVKSNAERKLGMLNSILAESSINGVSKGPTFDTTATEILKISAGTSRRDFFVNEDDFKHVDLPPNEVAKFRLEPGDLLACRFNGNLHYVGRFSYYRGVSGRTQVNPDKLIRFRIDRSKHCPRYVCYAMNSADARTAIESMCATTAGNIGLSAGKLKTVEIPLPPLAEQKRIVAKVDELIALYDRLEAQQQERTTRHDALARASLARFADAPTPANLDFLFHPSYAIPPADLRKSILTLAVQGKLVPQDPNDEPAKDCLSRLGLKSTVTTLNGAEVDDDSFPPAWARVRFEDVALVAGGVTLGRKLGERKTVTLPYLRVANVKRGEIERHSLREYDLLMTERGDWDKVGRAAIWRGEVPVCLHQNHVFRARVRSTELAPFWFERYFNSPVGRGNFKSASKKTTNLASINMRQVRSCPIPLPPLAEQRRIVAKVEQLMALVDALEQQLATAANLLSALVAELTGTVSRLPSNS